jgi:hypothetical protein
VSNIPKEVGGEAAGNILFKAVHQVVFTVLGKNLGVHMVRVNRNDEENEKAMRNKN